MQERVNRAAWLLKAGAPVHVAPAPFVAPAADEIVVRNRAVAINPLDWILQEAGSAAFAWLKFPAVLGSDLAGEVVEVGTAVTRFKPGDRVVAHALGSDKSRSGAAEGAFQDYAVVWERMAAPIPATLSFCDACVLPLGLSTAACALFEKNQLGLEYPSVNAPAQDRVVIVWGGSTSVGSNAIQLAVAAGYDVLATASPQNFEYVRRLGATSVFDYRSPSVVSDIVAALRGKTIAGAFAIGTTSGLACLDIVSSCKGNRYVSMATFPVSFDGFSQRPRVLSMLRLASQAVPFALAVLWKTRFRRVRSSFVFGSSLAYNELSKVIYSDFLPDALGSGRYTAAPKPFVVGEGLSSIQGGIDRQRAGVSAQKVVVTLN